MSTKHPPGLCDIIQSYHLRDYELIKGRGILEVSVYITTSVVQPSYSVMVVWSVKQ